MKILAVLAAAISAFSISEQQANEFLRFVSVKLDFVLLKENECELFSEAWVEN